MESGKIIIGSRLTEIQKKPGAVKLVFENPESGETYTLSFNGLLFETLSPVLDKKVNHIQINGPLGFKSLTQLRYLHEDPHNYEQLFIQMKGSNDENKFELLGAVRNLKLSRKRRTVRRKTVAKSRKNEASE